MPLAIVHSRGLDGLSAPEVAVEVHLAGGLPQVTLVGLPDTEVKEARDRVRAALQNSGFEFPAKRITVNLAPADLPKESGRFDLPIALGILAASGQIPDKALNDYEFAGELSLSGQLRPIRGALAMVLAASDRQRSFVLPEDSAREAALASNATILKARSLLEVCAHLAGQGQLEPCLPDAGDAADPIGHPDLSDVRGQTQAKRVLEIAAAGAHSILFAGPPGSGKSMLATRLPGLLPPMTEAAALESAAVLSLAGQFRPEGFKRHPYRSPHHTASSAALVGGGSMPRPGEISLAHQGVLFLDELPEFDRRVLEALREPMESGRIHISRAARQADFPAQFQLIAAMNPCPCATPRGKRTGQPLPLHAGPGGALSRQALWPAARPHRPANRSAGAAGRGAAGRRRGRVFRGRPPARHRRARATARAPEQAKRAPQYQGNRHPLPA